MSEICQVCAETMTRRQRRPVCCFQCQYTVCTCCVEKYVLQSIREAHCMQCHVVWNRMFLAQHMTQTFMTKNYVHHRESMLWNEEHACFADTMPVLEAIHRRDEMNSQRTELMKQQQDIAQQIEILNGQFHQQNRRIERMTRHLSRGQPAHGEPEEIHDTTTNSSRQPRHEYHRPCPSEECRGFLHNDTGLCHVCQRTTCLTCNCVKQENEATSHECREEDIEQWKNLEKTTKPCPGCHVRIFKVSGCSQMWCPMCHTAFHWTTGKIETGPIHNPHYYEWMFGQRTGPLRQRLDGPHPCRQVHNNYEDHLTLPPLREIVTLLEQRPTKKHSQTILKYHRKSNHIRSITLPEIRRHTNITSHRLRRIHLRIDYLSKKIDEPTFKLRLQRLEKKHQKYQEYIFILETFLAMSRDLFQLLCTTPTFSNDQFLVQFKEITSISNDAIRQLNRCYQSSLDRIHIMI